MLNLGWNKVLLGQGNRNGTALKNFSSNDKIVNLQHDTISVRMHDKLS